MQKMTIAYLSTDIYVSPTNHWIQQVKETIH